MYLYGIGICWDQWFPEVGRILALKGAELIFFPSAIGGGLSYPEIAVDRMKEMWILASRAQAVMNLIYVGALNRPAEEGDIRFFGGSFFANPTGEIVSRAIGDGNEIVTCDVDLDFLRKTRRW